MYNKLRLNGNGKVGTTGQNYESRIMIQQHLKPGNNTGILEYMTTVDPNCFSPVKQKLHINIKVLQTVHYMQIVMFCRLSKGTQTSI